MGVPADEKGIAMLRVRHQENRTVASHASGHPVLGKANEGGVSPVPARTVVPIEIAALRTWLEPAERIGRIGMAMDIGVRPDEYIHPGGRIPLIGTGE